MSRRITLLVVLVFLTGCVGGPSDQVNTPVPIQASPDQPAAAQVPPAQEETEAPPAAVAATAHPAGQIPTAVSTTLLPLVVESARTIPDPQAVQWRDLVTNLPGGVGLANAGDGSGRLFVLIQEGTIRILQNGAALDTPFLDITDRVGSSGLEQGLLGIAFHPSYEQNGFFYVNYTDKNGDTVIARFQAGPDPNRADPASEKMLIQVDQPYPNHNGGSVVFGPDGYLYLGLGDGGSAGDPHGNGQSVNTLLGKILRIDVNQGDPYAIPPDNPFAQGGGAPEIWAYGLRNPWRFSFDAQTQDLYIADVGQRIYEEIDFLPAGSPGGANFGWDYREGAHDFEGPVPSGVAVVEPVFEYTHAEGGCSVTGGDIYRGSQLPLWQGVYLFGDYCSGKIWGLLRNPDGAWEGKLLFQTDYSISSFGVDEQNEIYVVDIGGRVARLDPR